MMYGVQLFETLNGVPKPYLRERIMASIATGMVVLWKVVNKGTANERVEFVSDEQVSLYVGDGSEEADATSILGKYILDEVAKVAAKAGATVQDQLDKAKELLKAACEGLLEVVDITRAPIKPPSVR